MVSTTSASELPDTSIPIFTTVGSYRSWRKNAFKEGNTVGFVATMGALHEGHLTLVRRSLEENDLTVVSIFVNPAQFAPHEDLATYPRTLPTDVKLLETIHAHQKPLVIFAPGVNEIYPSGIVQSVGEQKGTFVEVKGYGHQMEGGSRPTFFRGVTTVVTKLFNIIQPDNTYFGQKDIQQALLLKRLCRDLILAYPTYQCLHIVPTARDPTDGLALSSRNIYLTSDGRKVAPTLRQALLAAEKAWYTGLTTSECLDQATQVIEARKAQASSEGLEVEMKVDYIQMNDADTFDVLDSSSQKLGDGSRVVILSGALYLDKTRLIDNLLLGDAKKILG